MDQKLPPTSGIDEQRLHRNRLWSYSESTLLLSILLVVGYALQWTQGAIPAAFTHWPLNAYFFVLSLIGLPILWWRFSEKPLMRWLAGIPNAIVAIIFFTVLTVMMGILPQHAENGTHAQDLAHRLGLYSMTQTWPFAFILLYLMVSLAFSSLKRCFPLKKQSVGYLLGHAGLFITLLAATLGSGDVQRLRLEVQEGSIEWRAQGDHGHVYELPIAVKLNEFAMDEFPPKLALAEREEGKMIEEGKGQDLLEFSNYEPGEVAELHGYQIEILTYIKDSFQVQDRYVSSMQTGSAQALEIKVSKDGQSWSGWVTAGSYLQPPRFLDVNDGLMIASPLPEPKSYASEVELIAKNGERLEAVIEVNKPVSFAGYKLYQLSYDDRFGKWSESSVIEVISDPWLPVVYFGIFMMMASAFYMMWIAQGKSAPKAHTASVTKNSNAQKDAKEVSHVELV